MLDKKRPLLKASPKIRSWMTAHAHCHMLIERYIAEGQPVGSRTLSQVFDLSLATIRNVMADLEELGLIHSPHTSAGRVPTPRGYRMFIDSLLAVRACQFEPAHIGELLPVSEPSRAVNAAAALCPTSPSSSAWCYAQAGPRFSARSSSSACPTSACC